MIDFIGTTQVMFGAATGSSGSGTELLSGFAPLIIIFGIFYFLLIRPQQKKQQHHQQMLGNLKRGDKVITTGGVYGTIEGITDATLHLKIANQVKITISRSAIAGLQPGETPATEEKK